MACIPLTDEAREKYTEMFHSVDKEFGKGNGKLNVAEFERLLAMCGILMPRQMIGATFVEADKNEDWRISLEEFLQEIRLLTASEVDPKEVSRKKFEELDVDGDSLLSFEDVKEFLFEILPGIDEELMKKFFEASDQDNDGKINLYQFSLIFMTHVMPGSSKMAAAAPVDGSDSSVGDRIRQKFEESDADKDGFVTVKDLRGFLTEVFPEYTKRDQKLLFDLYDDDSDGKISLGEFISLYVQDVLPFEGAEHQVDRKMSDELLGDKVRQKFEAYDKDGDGFLSKKDVKSLIYATFPHLREETLNEGFFSTFDDNGDGKISYEEFIPMFLFHLRPDCYYDTDSEVEEEERKEVEQMLAEANARREAREISLRKQFEESDLNKDGLLTFEELTEFLTKNFPDADRSQLKDYFDSWDDDKDGKINFLEFIPMFIDMVWVDSDDED